MTRNDTTHASTYVKIVHHPPVARRVCHFSNSFLSYYTDYNSLCNTGKDIELIKYLHSGKNFFYEDKIYEKILKLMNLNLIMYFR